MLFVRLSYLLLINHLIYLTLPATVWTTSCNNENPCNDTTIDCVSTGDCIVSCSGIQSCSNSIINCPSDGNCQIHCDNVDSCKAVKVNGATDKELSIYCVAPTSCSKATLNAAHTSLLSIEGCSTNASCLDLTIYCPPNSNGTQNCFIEGNNNLGASNEWDPMHIYATYGWLDVSIEYNGTYNDRDNPYYHAAIMHCTNVSAYDTQCETSINDWSCRNPSDYCNNPTPLTTTTTTTTATTPTTTNNITDLLSIIDINKIIVPLSLAIVLMCCLIGACCVWYKILCVPSKSKTVETKTPSSAIDDHNGENENEFNIRSGSDIIDLYKSGYRPSSQDSPALSSVALSSVGAVSNIHYAPDSAKRNRPQTIDLQMKNRSASHNNPHHNNRHKKRQSSLSSLVVPAPSRQRRVRSNGSISSHDRSRSGPFNIHQELEGTGIKDYSEIDPDPEGFSVHIGDDIEDDDIKSELPNSPDMDKERMINARDSDSDIYLQSEQPLSTPKYDPLRTPKNVMAQMVLSVENNMRNDMDNDNDSEGSGSDLYLKPDSKQTITTIGIELEPQRRHTQMSMDIATDVSVASRVII